MSCAECKAQEHACRLKAQFQCLGPSGRSAAVSRSRHLETERDTFVAAKSVHLDFVAPGDYMHIDLASAESLELVRPLQPAATGSASKAQSSLFGCDRHAAPLP